MSLVEQINTDLTVSMKSGEVAKTGLLRLLKNSLKNEQIKIGHDLGDDEAMKVLAREAKQRKDSIAAYTSGSRADLAAVEQAELDMIGAYLPAAMEEEELVQLIDQVVVDTGATSQAQMGLVIGRVMSLAQGRVDGADVSRLVRQKLG